MNVNEEDERDLFLKEEVFAKGSKSMSSFPI